MIDVIRFETLEGKNVIIPMKNIFSIEESNHFVIVFVCRDNNIIPFSTNMTINELWGMFKTAESIEKIYPNENQARSE